MMHYGIGNLGHLLVIISFVAALLSTVSYFRSWKNPEYRRFSNILFYVHSIAVVGIVTVLYLMINNHYFEYHYVWSHFSRLLPWYYQISCFWEGQEGSFLLWIFWNVLLGVLLLRTSGEWKPGVMTVLMLTQTFLTSMILGPVLGDLKIGSSPFMLLRDVLDAPVFTSNPAFVPEDGSGLNPLLQNYWMVIHPPTLFLGFAMTVVPFAYLVAGLWKGKYKEWVKPALPWLQFAVLILGIGILMGAYWAYETLNFGGYWNWDPVENAIYVPWLILVAAMHTMITYSKNPSALKISIILVVTGFILVVYSTYLVRSGVLGDSSVHSFTDAGLSNQLLLYLIVFFFGSLVLMIRVWPKLPGGSSDISVYSREFWIFLGAATLSLMALQVILPTSIPAINQLVRFFGFESNVAIPADQVGFYSYYQLFFAVALALLSGTGQFFWWNKMDKAALKAKMNGPIMISLLISAGIMIAVRKFQWEYILLLLASVYTIVANGSVFLFMAKKNIRLSGGAITHMGIGLMLLGILFSSAYEKMLSVNYTGKIWSRELPDDINQNNLLLFVNEPMKMDEYELIYLGERKNTREAGFVPTERLLATSEPNVVVVRDSINTQYQRGDTLNLINFENTYFEVRYTRNDGKRFTLYPRVQINEEMDMMVPSPDIRHYLTSDVYTHVKTFPNPESEEWSEMDTVRVTKDTTFYINDYVATFRGASLLKEWEGKPLGPEDFVIRGEVDVLAEGKIYRLIPEILKQGEFLGRIPDESKDIGAKITIISADQQYLVLGISTRQKDWIIIEAVEKPMINLLWIGTGLLCIGFGVAISRRYREFRLSKSK